MKNYILDTGKYNLLLEGKGGNGTAEALLKMGGIKMPDGKTVDGGEFVKAVNSAFAYFEANYPFEYKFISTSPVIYLLNNVFCNTMCVDGRGVVYINVEFLYNKIPDGLDMNPKNIFNILYHECMHTFLDHIRRIHEYNKEHDVNKLTWSDMNIASDLEVNGMMTVDKVCGENFWLTLKGCYSKRVLGLPMESIASNYKDIIDAFKRKANNVPQIHVSQNNDRDSGASLSGNAIRNVDNMKQRLVGEIIRQSEVDRKLRESLERSGFDEDTISSAVNSVEGTVVKSEDELSKLRNSILKSRPKTRLGEICRDIKILKESSKNKWGDVVKSFLEHNTLFAGKRKVAPNKKRIRWGDRRTIAHGIMSPYHPKGDPTKQNINVLVDVSGSIDTDLTILFARSIVNYCDTLEYSGVLLIPFASSVDKKSSVYFDSETAKNDKDAIINKIIEMTDHNNAGGGTNIESCVDCILDSSKNDSKSVWIVFTDGEFTRTKSLEKLVSSSSKILFVIYNEDFDKKFKGILTWCVDPALESLSKCYIDLNEKNKD